MVEVAVCSYKTQMVVMVFFIANDHIRLDTGGTERIRIDSSGNVGIGNTSPAKKLEISSGTDGDGILLTGTGGFATGFF